AGLLLRKARADARFLFFLVLDAVLDPLYFIRRAGQVIPDVVGHRAALFEAVIALDLVLVCIDGPLQCRFQLLYLQAEYLQFAVAAHVDFIRRSIGVDQRRILAALLGNALVLLG